MKLVAAIAALAVLLSACLQLRSESVAKVSFPLEYRAWTHVKTMLIGPGHPAFATEGGIHHIYANEEALKGLRFGKFPDGSILVYDLLSVEEKGGIASEGPRRRVDVMVKDSKAFPKSGGWGFERFMGDKHNEGVLTDDRRAECFGCHSTQKDRDFVFSKFRR